MCVCVCVVMCFVCLQTGFGLVNGFIDNLYKYTWLITTATLHNSQITTTLSKPFPACCIFTNRSLATSELRSSCHRCPCRTPLKCTRCFELSCSHLGTDRNHPVSNSCRRHQYTFVSYVGLSFDVYKIHSAKIVEFSMRNALGNKPYLLRTGINKSVAANVILTILYLWLPPCSATRWAASVTYVTSTELHWQQLW
jgi:hypothetical protein